MDKIYPLSTNNSKLLVIVGESGSGKSELALKVAEEFNGEIIAADSWTVYRSFDIGTSKPSKEEQGRVKHHLIDVADPKKGFNAPKFKELAESAIQDINNRGKLPIMVGGTGLYIDSILFDFGFLPNLGADERQKLDQMSIAELTDLASSRSIDLSGVDIRNKRRVIRAIEADGQVPTKKQLRGNTLIIGLQMPREELRRRIVSRVDQMIRKGLEQEVKALSERYGWDIEPMKGIGYREWREYFEGRQTLEQTKQRIISATMNLAKRQRTWFKRNQNIQWFSSSGAAYNFLKNPLNT